MDEKTKEILDKLKLNHVKIITLKEIETEALLNAKKDRTVAEYCWTLTPQTPKIVFDREPTAQRVTYLDADMFFLKSPEPIFSEFESSGKSVLITEHAYDAEYDHSQTCGQYCVQFMSFNRDKSESFRIWWADNCTKWCYAYKEENKFGDQKYLEQWDDQFPDEVHVLKQVEVLIAPWNAKRFPYSGAIAWHFHGLKLLSNNKVLQWGNYEIPIPAITNIYSNYLRELSNIIKILEMQSFKVRPQGKRRSFFEVLRFFVRSAKRIYIRRTFSSTKIENV